MKRTKRLRRMVVDDHYDRDDFDDIDAVRWRYMKQLMRENLTGELPDKMMDMQRSEPISEVKNNSRSAWFSEDYFRINHCFVLNFSFWPQSISSQRSKGKEIRALKSPSASWEHKNRGGHSQTSKFNLVKRNMRDCLKYFPIYRYFQTAISGLGQYVKGSNTTWCIGWNWSDLRGTLTLDVVVVCKTPSTPFEPLKIPRTPLYS